MKKNYIMLDISDSQLKSFLLRCRETPCSERYLHDMDDLLQKVFQVIISPLPRHFHPRIVDSIKQKIPPSPSRFVYLAYELKLIPAKVVQAPIIQDYSNQCFHIFQTALRCIICQVNVTNRF